MTIVPTAARTAKLLHFRIFVPLCFAGGFDTPRCDFKINKNLTGLKP